MEETKKEVKGVEKAPKIIKEDEVAKKPFRQIIIETDGDNIHISKAEVSGKIELIGVLQNVIAFITNQK